MEEKYYLEISARTSMNDYKKEEWLLNLPFKFTIVYDRGNWKYCGKRKK